jgi:hypothetical protein
VTAAATSRTPATAVDDRDGNRWYIHPTTGERFISVTTVLGNIAKYGLTGWAARLAAEAAFDRLPWLNRASRTDVCNSTGTDNPCGACRDCVTYWLADRHNQVRDDAADLGRKLHDAAEHDALFGVHDDLAIDDDTQPLVEAYREWRDRYQPVYEATEMTVLSRKWGYAGTLDAILHFTKGSRLPKGLAHLVDVPICVDYKTSRSVDITKGWQVVAYSKADAVLLPDGTELPMPRIDGGMILHFRRPDDTHPTWRTQMREVHVTDANHSFFVHMLRVVEGLAAGLNTVLSRPVTTSKDA